MEADRHMLQPDIGVMRASFSSREDAVGYAEDIHFCALVYGDSPILERTTSLSAANIAGRGSSSRVCRHVDADAPHSRDWTEHILDITTGNGVTVTVTDEQGVSVDATERTV